MAGLRGLYGEGTPLPPEQVVQAAPTTSSAASATPMNPQPGGTALQFTRALAEGQAAVAQAAQPEVSLFESAKAQVRQWDTANALKTISRSNEPAVPGHTNSALIDQVPFMLAREEREFLNEANSPAEFRTRLGDVKEARDMARVAGDHPVLAFMIGALDPAYLAADVLSAGAGTVVHGSRLVRGLAAAGTAGTAALAIGATAAQSAPRSTEEIMFGALLNAAAAPMVLKGKQAVKADPDFPDKELAAHATVPPTRAEVEGTPPHVVATQEVTTPEGVSKTTTKSDGSTVVEHPTGEVVKTVPPDAERVQMVHPEVVEDVPTQAEGGMSTGAKVALAGAAALGVTTLNEEDQGLAGAMLLGTIATKGKLPRVLKPAVYAPIPPALVNPAAHTHAQVVAAVDKSLAQRVGESIGWNMHKTMANFGEVGRKVADTLFDNNMNLGQTSVEAEHRAIRADLTAMQAEYEQLLKNAMAEQGVGTMQRITNWNGAAHAKQAEIEKAVQMEGFRREQLTQQGKGFADPTVPKHITAMADALDKLHAKAVDELVAAGVEGADAIRKSPGWLHRRWNVQKIEDITAQFKATGLDAKAAHKATVALVAKSLAKANSWDAELANDVAGSLINRAIRKGYFEDQAFNVSQGAPALKQMRDILTEEGLSGKRLERAMAVLEGRNKEAGKAGFLKHRLDLDYSASVVVGGKVVRVTDMIDSNVHTLVDQYLDGVAQQSAFARKGLRSSLDITHMRDELLHSIGNPLDRKEAAKLFDNVIAHMQGRPAGEEINQGMRAMAAYGRMIALASSGIWQASEYATVMAKYGILRTTKAMMQEMPLFRQLYDTGIKDKLVSSELKDILTRTSTMDMRMRPYLQKYEDGFDLPMSATLQLKLQQAQQLVPYLNAMKYVHNHQAVVTANLIVNRLVKAVGGHAETRAMFQKYGIDGHVMDKLSADIKLHGMDTAKWSDGTWAEVRPTFAKMMDEAVLKARLGDTPAFARFDKVGKFIFTYRSFVLTAHNKILAGGLGRDGLAGVSLMLAYQLPLAAMAVQAQSVLSGKGALAEKDMLVKAVGLMGGIGMFSELWGIITGTKQQFGTPGLIPIDRAYHVGSSLAQGNFGQASAGAVNMLPLLGVIQPIRAVGELVKQ